MALQSNIVLNDGQTTPAAHTFIPKGSRVGADGVETATWKDQTPVNSEGYLSIIEKHTAPNGNGMEKFVVTFDLPTLESPGAGATFVPPPTRAYGTIGKIEVWAHKRASAQELKDIVAYVKNYAASAQFAQMITNREASW